MSLLLFHHLGRVGVLKQNEAFGLCGTLMNLINLSPSAPALASPSRRSLRHWLLVHKHPSHRCCPALSASQPWLLPCSLCIPAMATALFFLLLGLVQLRPCCLSNALFSDLILVLSEADFERGFRALHLTLCCRVLPDEASFSFPGVRI